MPTYCNHNYVCSVFSVHEKLKSMQERNSPTTALLFANRLLQTLTLWLSICNQIVLGMIKINWWQQIWLVSSKRRKPLPGQGFCDLLFRVSAPDVEASGKNDSAVCWIWFVTKEEQRQAPGGGARLLRRWGRQKDQKKKKISWLTPHSNTQRVIPKIKWRTH